MSKLANKYLKAVHARRENYALRKKTWTNFHSIQSARTAQMTRPIILHWRTPTPFRPNASDARRAEVANDEPNEENVSP